MCLLLSGHTKHIIVSFVDNYKNVRKNNKTLNYREFTEEDYRKIGFPFSKIASKCVMTVQTYFEKKSLVVCSFIKDECLSHTLKYNLTEKVYKKWTARGCSCVEMVDIGTYNSCKDFCKYCYANYDETKVNDNFSKHNSNSSFLIGTIEDSDIIKIRNK